MIKYNNLIWYLILTDKKSSFSNYFLCIIIIKRYLRQLHVQHWVVDEENVVNVHFFRSNRIRKRVLMTKRWNFDMNLFPLGPTPPHNNLPQSLTLFPLSLSLSIYTPILSTNQVLDKNFYFDPLINPPISLEFIIFLLF